MSTESWQKGILTTGTQGMTIKNTKTVSLF